MAGDAPDFSVGTVDLSPIMVNTMPILKNYPGGNVFYFDNFEGSNITWEIVKENNPDYGFAEIDKTQAYIGAGCARLYHNENQQVGIRLGRQFQFRSSDTIGIEFSFMLSDVMGVEVELIYEYKMWGTLYRFSISLRESCVAFPTPEGSYFYPYSPGNGLSNMTWNNVKVIINTKDHRFVRLYYGKDVFDIDHPAMTLTEPGDESPLLHIGCYFGISGFPAKSLWIDKVILTDDETI